MDAETLKAISELSNSGLLAVVSYSLITSISEIMLSTGIIFGVRAIWRKINESYV